MTVEGQPPERLYHRFTCDCSYEVRAEDFTTIERLANRHTRTCKQPSRQETSIVPFMVIVPDDWSI